MKKEKIPKLLSFIYYQIHPLNYIITKPFDEFNSENMYFLDGLTDSEIKREYQYFTFFETIRNLKINISKIEIIEYIDNQLDNVDKSHNLDGV
jgi:hypothetical protein